MNRDNIIYDHNVVEFAQVGVQFCALLEQCAQLQKADLTDQLTKLMPLMYLKALLLPKVESQGDFLPDGQVTEDDYNYVRNSLYAIIGKDDEYLDFCYDRDGETDESQWKSLSEGLADIYQPVRNFLATYQTGVELNIEDALWKLQDEFELYWGQTLVDSLRQLHRLKMNNEDITDEI